MKIIFMGTPDFAVPCLQRLIDEKHEIAAVFTQPDKPKGRGYKLTPPPVKELALTHDIPVFQPNSLKPDKDTDNSIGIIKEIAPDVIVVVAYGKILPKEILDIPQYGCINIHASLLPKYRGAAPIQRCVLDGVSESGVTTMMMAEGLDTGDMLLTEKVTVGENDTASQLHDKLSAVGAELIAKTLDGVKAGTVTQQKQDDSKSTYASMIFKDECPTNFFFSAQQVHNHIRGLEDFPAATAMLGDKVIKLFGSRIILGCGGKESGEVVKLKPFTVRCGDGNGVSVEEIQAPGSKRMKISDYLLGNKIEVGTILK